MGAGETEMDKSRSATNLVVPTIDASTNVAADIDDVYGVNVWGAGMIKILPNGNIGLCQPEKPDVPPLDLLGVINDLQQRGIDVPVLLRVTNFLESRITQINEAFAEAITEAGYQGLYRGVFPVKVNQQAQVIERIVNFGSQYEFGLEVGSKAELLIALSQDLADGAAVICNGTKDSEFLSLAMLGQRLGVNIFIVIESLRELDLVVDVATKLNVRPQLGVRVKLTNQVSGNWAKSSGDRSTFGLTIAQIADLIERLRAQKYLDCLVLQHSHLGSQIPDIIDIRKATQEACRFFSEIRLEGAPLHILDLGGGLGVDYTGEHTAGPNSINYTLGEYCKTIIETVKYSMDEAGINHPVIITESGRSCVAQSSMLLFNVLEATHYDSTEEVSPQASDHPILHQMLAIEKDLGPDRIQECWNSLRYYRDEMRALFRRNQVSLAMTARTERAYLYLINRIKNMLRDPEAVTADLQAALTQVADIYHCNFSLFQSLPDVWAIDQLHPIAPVQRLHEAPQRRAILSDITCDSDGKIDHFVLADGISETLPVHDFGPEDDYYLAVFFIGAYQETLGDLHNLFGDTNVVTISLMADGGFELVQEQDGDTVSEVLSYVEYNPRDMAASFKAITERAVQAGHLTASDRKTIMTAYSDAMNGYTYFEH